MLQYYCIRLLGGIMSVPELDGIHHVKLPVRDLARSREWYESRLGYRTAIEFIEQGELKGLSMRHPNGGPELALRLDPDRAVAAAGFDYFAIGVPSKEAIEDLAARLSALGQSHAGVHFATIGWILPGLHDPDGHEVRFYTTTHHREPPAEGILRVENPREAAEAAERAMPRPGQADGPSA
jgi:catechol 2,3-dioxygenase-like lactoylglutathione lyase family enzyme